MMLAGTRDLEEERRRRNLRTTQLVLVAWQLCGLAAVIAYAVSLQRNPQTGFLRPATTGALLAGGFMFSGFLVGFLFGIPKTRQEDSAKGVLAGGSGEQSRLSTNTNLEQISDWLTKVLVGVGLTQIEKIGSGLWKFASQFKSTFGSTEASESFVVGIVVYFLTCGFLSGYFWTRLFLASAFSLADREVSDLSLVAREAHGIAESAREVAEAAIQRSSAPSGIRPDEARETMQSLIAEYNSTREAMSSGDVRTGAMTRIFNRLVESTPYVRDFNVREALFSSDRGIRLAAYARLYALPDSDLFDDLVESVTSKEDKPFAQFWGLRAIGRVAEHVGSPSEAALSRLRNLLQSLPPTSDRYAEVQRVLGSLSKAG